MPATTPHTGNNTPLVQIGDITFEIGERDPSPVFNWSIDHRVLEIPINGFADITIGLSGDGADGHASSGSLWHLKVAAKSVTAKRFRQFWQLSMLKGPYIISAPETKLYMYLKHADVSRDVGGLAPPYPMGEEAEFHAKWSFDFVERND